MWAMEYGRRHVRRDVYDDLKALNGHRNVDLTRYSALLLMSFSSSDLIRFSGLYYCAHIMTSCL